MLESAVRCVVCRSMDWYVTENDLENNIQDSEISKFTSIILDFWEGAYKNKRNLINLHLMIQ